MPRHCVVAVLALIASMFLVQVSRSQSRLLDDFENLSGWRALPSEGANLKITSGEGKDGRAMVMEFDLVGVYGYTIAQKDFPLDLPDNYQFTFDVKAECPVNNFEFKLLDDKGNVYWIKKLNVQYPRTWEKQRIKKRHIAFAWGPAGGGEIRKVSKIEFVVSSGTGGKGKVYIDNFRFEPIDESLAKTARCVFDASSLKKGGEPTVSDNGTVVTNWRGGSENEWVSLNFNYEKEIGGLVLDWDRADYAVAYNVQLSDDGKEWTTVYTVNEGNGGRDFVYLPEKDAGFVKINFTKSKSGKGYNLPRLEVRGPEFSQSPNDFFSSVAKESPKGFYPKYFLNQQSYWTVVGTNGDTKEALMNEQGTVEVDQLRFSLEPFLFVNNKLVTWNDVSLSRSLLEEYIPIPSVTWKYAGLELTVRAFSAGTPGKSTLIVSYTIENKGGMPPKGKLFVAMRPFQVNPPWQWLNKVGGASRIDSIRNEYGLLHIQDKLVIPISNAAGFGATTFDSGDIVEYLQNGQLPPRDSVVDREGFASAALEYNYYVESGNAMDFHIAVPFHDWPQSPVPNMREGADVYASMAFHSTRQQWESKLNDVQLFLPPSAGQIANTIKANLGYIFINRDGPRIQPGSRSYERSWIRDGALTSTALLQMGMKAEVKEFLDWYSKYQFPNGKIPCVVDERGGDPTAEHDSHGEYIYAIRTYFNFTNDTAWLRGKYDNVVKTVRYIQSLRSQRKTDLYRNGTPEQRACFGLMPESISHEGYSAKPMHSYWDDFFTLRGLKDATAIAGILGDKTLEAEFAAERDDCSADLYVSIRLTMKNKNISYIPGCAELGDFDATSTTIALCPVDEIGSIPEPELHNTFDKYYSFFKDRKEGKIQWKDYTPYENRLIGSFVYLDQKERAHELLDFFMNDRRPAEWKQWPEVVYKDPATPKFIGDLPHTWCGSDFIRSVRSMFVYERERDTALVLGAGIADAWVKDTSGIGVSKFPTWYGDITYTMKMKGKKVTVQLSGNVHAKMILKSPLSQDFISVMVDGRKVKTANKKELVLYHLPAKVELNY